MFTKKPNDLALVFQFKKKIKIDLHMFFVFYPIDVLFLDEHKKVIEIKENFRPFTLYYTKHDSKYVVELPSGTVAKSKTEIGHKMEF